MIKRIFGGFVAVMVLAPAAALAQDEPATAYIYVTYFECNPSGEARADEIVKRNFGPHYDAAVAGGDIRSWSWLAHFVGGKWRRALVLTASNMDDLLDSAGALGEIIEDATPEAGRVFTEVCDAHEDYIWEASAGSASAEVGSERGPAGFSMYLQCDQNEEEKADQIVTDSIAPIYNRQVAEGNLVSWGWLRHNVGGQWRRLLTSTAADHKTMMKTRAAIAKELRSGRTERALRQLTEICPVHSDYMWDIQIETP